MKTIALLDNTLQIDVRYACEDADLEDNICIKISESCPENEAAMKKFLNPSAYKTPAELRKQ